MTIQTALHIAEIIGLIQGVVIGYMMAMLQQTLKELRDERHNL